MKHDKSLASELQSFARSWKQNQESMFRKYQIEEKHINEKYRADHQQMTKIQKKKLRKFNKSTEERKRLFRKKLEKEFRKEKKRIRNRPYYRPHSLTHLNENSGLNSGSVLSLDTSLRDEITRQSLEVINSGQVSDINNINNNNNSDKVKPKWRSQLLKSSSSKYELACLKAKLLAMLQKDMEERFSCCTQEANHLIAECEWKLLLERQEMKREFMNSLNDLKKRRLMAVGHQIKLQIKGYYDIQRKWLIRQHARELEERNETCRELLKRLGDAHVIERNTTCKLVKDTSKGQQQMSHILKSVMKNEDDIKQSEYVSILSGVSDLNRTELQRSSGWEPLWSKCNNYEVNDQSSYPTTLVSTNRSRSHVSSSTPKSINASENSSQHSRSNIIQSCHTNRISSVPRTKSTYSVNSTLVAYDKLQKSIVNMLVANQTEQWATIMEQEREVTESLVRSHAEQLKSLNVSESNALKRAQLEYDSRAVHLAVTLEANRKFMEEEFVEELKRVIRFYFGEGAFDKRNTPDWLTGYANNNLDILVNKPQEYTATATTSSNRAITKESATNIPTVMNNCNKQEAPVTRNAKYGESISVSDYVQQLDKRSKHKSVNKCQAIESRKRHEVTNTHKHQSIIIEYDLESEISPDFERQNEN